MSGRKSISQDKLDKVCKSLKEKDFRELEDKEWIKMFNDIPLIIRREIIKLLEKEQSLSIIKGMHYLNDNIEVPFLGKFSIKEARKDFINLKRENPDLPIEEVAKLVKENYRIKNLKRKTSKKCINLKPIKNEDRLTS